jgi:tRNA uridine 5-carbamoylmethylation protein Kti12
MADAAATGLPHPSSPSTTAVLHDATIILLCGLPASGKSQLARQVCDYYSDHRDNDQVNDVPTICHHVEYDLLEQAQFDFQQQEQQQHPDNDSTNEEGADSTLRLQSWQQTRSVALKHLQRHLDLECFLQWNNLHDTTLRSITLSPRIPKLVILMDDNFHLRGMRKQVHRLLWAIHQQQQPQQDANETLPPARHGWNLHFGILHVDTPPEICRRRNQRRKSDQIVSDQVMDKMTRSIEVPPASNLMYWEACWKRIETTTTDTTSGTFHHHQDVLPTELLKDVIEFIDSCHPIVPVQIEETEEDDDKKEQKRQSTRINAQQTFDQRLRHYVSCVAQWNKTYARAANGARKELLHQHNPTARVGDEGSTGDSYLVTLFVDLVMALHHQDTSQKQQQRQNGNPEHNGEALKSTLISLLLDG